MKRSILIRNAIFLLALISFNDSVFSQDNPVYQKMPRITYPSGDAAALGRYGDYPVDKSTGVPSISIPVFEIQLNDFKVPISFSYHASGNKVDDISSVVGLGWVLNAGGCITRTVLDKPDEAKVGGIVDDVYNRQYMTREEIDSLPTNDAKTCQLNHLKVDGADLESDIYSFNFNGYSGQFRHDSYNNLVLSTYEDIKISGGPINGFLITTPDGTTYRFLYGDSTQVNSISSKSSWYLDQIVTPNSEIIDFHYKYPRVLLQGEHHPSFNCKAGTNSPWQFIEYIEVRKLRYLDNITFKNGKVCFTYGFNRKDLRPHQLLKISMIDAKGDTIKKVKLGQSYFVSDNSDPSTGSANIYCNRLKLDNINFVNPANASDISTYSFDYNPTNLPPYFEYFEDISTPNKYYSQDYWGYFNDAPDNNSLIPLMNSCSMDAADRNVNETAMQATVLRKIIFPTGGRTEYEYEANTNRGGGIKLGGLRVLKIKDFPDSQSTVTAKVRSYVYVGGGFTTKWLDYKPLNDVSKWFYLNLEIGYTFNYLSVPIGSFSFNNGAVARYDKVEVYTGEQQEILTEYNYDVLSEEEYGTNYIMSCLPAYPITYPIGYNGEQLYHHFYPLYYKDESYLSGQLKSQYEFKKVGSEYELVKEIENFWTPYHIQNVIVGLKIVPVASAGINCVQGGDPNCMFQYFNVMCQMGVKKLDKSVERFYSGSGIIGKTVEYEYGITNNPNSHGFVTKETITNSAGEKNWKINRYLPDVFPSPSGIYQIMNAKYMINNPLEVITGKKVNGTDLYLGANVYNYDLLAYLPKLSQIKSINLETPSTSYTNWSDSRLKTEITFDSYDPAGNLLNATPADNLPTGYQWGYNNSYPVAKVINSKNQTIYSTESVMEYIVFPANSLIELQKSFTTSTSGDMSFDISFGGMPNGTANFTFTLTGPSNKIGNICLSSGSGCGTTPLSIPYNGMPKGTYELKVVPNINDAGTVVDFQYHYKKQLISISSITEFYYQGFEEYTGATASTTALPSHAGRYYNTSPFTIPFVKPNNRSYIVEYYYWNGIKWISERKPFTDNMILSDGTAIDEIRVYPTDAQMTTYTYDPLIGMTSSTDENNMTSYYEYDGFGRLKCMKDKDGNILKTYDYHYFNK